MKSFTRINRRPDAKVRQALSISLAIAIMVCAIPLSRSFHTRASNPMSGTISPAGPTQNWTGTAVGGSSADGETSCVEGVNCDTYKLTVAPGDYTGKLISVRIDWTVAANDYDLYVHKDSIKGPVVGTSAEGAPQTSEQTAIDPSASGPGDYFVHAVYFAVTPGDQYKGTASVVNKPTAASGGRVASYVKGGLSFISNVTVKAPVAARDGEPSSRTDNLGNFYVSGIRGFPAGIDLWYVDLQPNSSTYDPFMRNYSYRGQPDAFSPTSQADLGGDGGGDVDLAVGRPDPTTGMNNNPPSLASTSLIAANISSQKSTDKGLTYMRNPAGNATGGIPADDRQWLEALGPNSVYLLYRTLAPAVTQIQRSDDGGFSYGAASTAGQIGQVGQLDVHQKTGTVYISGSTGQVCVGTPLLPTVAPTTYTCTQAASDPNGVNHIFFVVKVADDGTPNGTAYVAYSNDHDIFLAYSKDKGATWSKPVRVSDGAETRTSVFPHLETGSTPGSVGIVWYGTTNPTNDDAANWNVFYAQTFNATDDSPTFRQAQISDHFIHGSNISEGGLTGTANRNLIDYFQVSFDPTGAAVVGYTDDHNDFDGHTYVARQISGPSINNAKASVPTPAATPAPQSGPLPLAASVGGLPGSQVTDFRQDVQEGLVGRVNADDPLDILSIKYSCETTATGTPVIVATMKVSALNGGTGQPPAEANWRMSFAANTLSPGLSPTGDYSFGVSDRGDQFFVRATTDAMAISTGTPAFSYGTAVRNPDGTITYTTRGAADCGSFDVANNTITVKVGVDKLNPLVKNGPAIGVGSVLAGLRGQTFTAGSASGKRDLTRGGTEFTVACNGTLACPAAGATPTPVPVATPTPTPVPVATPTPTPVPAATPTPTPVPAATPTPTPVPAATPVPTPVPAATPVPTPVPTPSPSVQFSSAAYTVNEAGTVDSQGRQFGTAFITVTRRGDSSAAATVDYRAADGTAVQKSDYEFASGTLRFAAGETEKNFDVLIVNDVYQESDETINLTLSNAVGATLGTQKTAVLTIRDNDTSTPTTNPIDETRFFVRMQYLDFLDREGDEGGYDYWTQQITQCGTDQACINRKRVQVSAAFFIEQEFQDTGSFIYRLNKASFGTRVPYSDFMNDRGRVVGGTQIEASKTALAEDFVQRPAFTTKYPVSQSAEDFVDALINTIRTSSNVDLTSKRSEILAAYNNGGGTQAQSRARALRKAIDYAEYIAAEYNRAFVLAEYFGYLRREPDEEGYNFWLNVLNNRVPNNYRSMVCAFSNSAEYQDRFSPVRTKTDSICSDAGK